MFDIGWTEMLVVACVAIIVVGPKDLPKVLRGFGRAMKSVRGLASDFQKQFEEAVKEADLDDVKNMASGKGFKPLDDIKKSVTSFEKDVKDQMAAKSKEIDDALDSKPVGLPEPVAAKLASMSGENKAASSSASAGEKKPAGKAAKATTGKASPKRASGIKPAAKAATTAKATATKPATAKKTASKSASGKSASSKTAKDA